MNERNHLSIFRDNEKYNFEPNDAQSTCNLSSSLGILNLKVLPSSVKTRGPCMLKLYASGQYKWAKILQSFEIEQVDQKRKEITSTIVRLYLAQSAILSNNINQSQPYLVETVIQCG